MASNPSNQTVFNDITALITRLKQAGHHQAANEIQSGYACLNGLTDGWVLLLESLQKVLSSHGDRIPADQKMELKALLGIVKKMVYR